MTGRRTLACPKGPLLWIPKAAIQTQALWHFNPNDFPSQPMD